MTKSRIRGPWDATQIESFLKQTVVPMRLACNGPEGYPGVVALWFVHDDGALWCAALRSSWTVRSLLRDGRCGFDISIEKPPYQGVRGQADVSVVAEKGAAVLGRCIERYLGGRDSDLARWLLSRASKEVALRLEPRPITSWDYRERMSTLDA